MIDSRAFALFETAIGTCGIAWSSHGIIGVQLPEASCLKMRARLRQRFPGAREAGDAPPAVRSTMESITSLLDGKQRDLSGVALDLRNVPAFHQRVYEVARTISPGSTLSYGELAARLGEPAWPAAREVGRALAHNPFPIVVPCHRVVAAGGKLGGFSAPGGLTTKHRLLSIENASFTRSSGESAPSSRKHAAAARTLPLFSDPV